MKKETADKIFQEIMDQWIKEFGGVEHLDPQVTMLTKWSIYGCPFEDGCMRVECFETKKTHLVPLKDMILKGLKGKDIEKYPVEDK